MVEIFDFRVLSKPSPSPRPAESKRTGLGNSGLAIPPSL